MASFSLALGTATKNRDGKIIEAFFPTPVLNPSDALVAAVAAVVDYKEGNQAIEVTSAQCADLAAAFSVAGDEKSAQFAVKAAQSVQPLVIVVLATDAAPASVA